METKKKTFRELTEEWPRYERGQRYLAIVDKTHLSYSSVTTARTRPCKAKKAYAITRGMIELGYVSPDTKPTDLFPESYEKKE